MNSFVDILLKTNLTSSLISSDNCYGEKLKDYAYISTNMKYSHRVVHTYTEEENKFSLSLPQYCVYWGLISQFITLSLLHAVPCTLVPLWLQNWHLAPPDSHILPHLPGETIPGPGTFPIARRMRPEGCLLQTRPSLAMGNVIFSHSFYSYSKWKAKISACVTGRCFPAPRDLWWNCFICERMAVMVDMIHETPCYWFILWLMLNKWNEMSDLGLLHWFVPHVYCCLVKEVTHPVLYLVGHDEILVKILHLEFCFICIWK
jgi:hypothetical protein